MYDLGNLPTIYVCLGTSSCTAQSGNKRPTIVRVSDNVFKSLQLGFYG